MNPAQLLLNQMMNSPQVQNNPMAKNAMQMYQSGDTGGLKTMAENLCKERGITVDEAKQKIMIDMLQPHTVLIVGKIPDELNADVKIVNYKSRNQKVNEEFYGNKNNEIAEKAETDREPEKEKRAN